MNFINRNQAKAN